MSKTQKASPKESNLSNRTLRLLETISYLPHHPKTTTVSELLGKLENAGYVIDKRSVERDLKMLRESQEFGPFIVCNDLSKPHGWSLNPNKHFMRMSPDVSMAVVWDLVGRYIQQLLPPAAASKTGPMINSAREWLQKNQVSSEPWSNKVAYIPRGISLKAASIKPAVLETVFEALHSGKQLQASYGTPSREFILHPRAIIDRGPVTYLVASTNDYENFRLYAMHRMQRAAMLDDKIRKLPFKLEEYINSGVLELPHGDDIALKLRFYNYAGDHLKETPLTSDQKVSDEDQGVMAITATVRDTEELFWWIQGFGANVEVLAPKALRNKVATSLKQAAARY